MEITHTLAVEYDSMLFCNQFDLSVSGHVEILIQCQDSEFVLWCKVGEFSDAFYV